MSTSNTNFAINTQQIISTNFVKGIAILKNNKFTSGNLNIVNKNPVVIISSPVQICKVR